MKPKVLFIVLPYLVKNIDSKRPKIRSFLGFPYGLLSVATYCKDLADIRIADYNVHQYNIPRLIMLMRIVNPDIVGFSMMFDNSYKYLGEMLKVVKQHNPHVLTVLGGAAPSYSYEEILAEQPDLDTICYSEGEIPMHDLLTALIKYGSFGGIGIHQSFITRWSLAAGHSIGISYINNLDDVIDIDYSFISPRDYGMEEAFSPYVDHKKNKQFFLVTSRGCPFKCLSGDTLVHTFEYGDVPIQNLVGKELSVLSREPISQRPIYAKAKNVFQFGKEKMVRVAFDDGSHIDCTPDHKFKVFSYKNQVVQEKEFDVEAKNLLPKQQVRAVRTEVNKWGRVYISTRRDIVIPRARIIMEAKIGRKLSVSERVHHADGNPSNDNSENLVLTDKSNHAGLHPEISKRMKENNPAKNMTPEWREKLRQSVIGKHRSLEQRIRYRESKLGKKNPNYKSGQYKHKSRIDVNHKVVSVTPIPSANVYCMEVPGINWFYANEVLVHNCTFCSNAKIHGKKMRFASVGKIIDHVEKLVKEHGMNVLTIYDDQLLIDLPRAKELFRRLIPYNLRIECPNGLSVAFIDDELAGLMKEAGMDTVYLAIESGSEYVLHELIQKPLKLKQVAPAIAALQKHGIFCHGFFVMGMPGETSKHRKETLHFIKNSGLDWAGLNMATPMRGSKLYDDCIKNGWIQKQKISDIVDKKYIIDTGTPPEIVEREVYLMNLDYNFVNNPRMKKGDYKTAAACFTDVIRRYENHAFAYYYLAECERAMAIGKWMSLHSAPDPRSGDKNRQKFYEIIGEDEDWMEYAEHFELARRVI